MEHLIDLKTPEFLDTQVIPDEYMGKKFDEIRGYFKEKDNSIVVGLLENVGSYLERKQEAIRSAQKTADVNKLIENLRSAKKMENNLPNINPPDDYIVPEHSMAILIGKKSA